MRSIVTTNEKTGVSPNILTLLAVGNDDHADGFTQLINIWLKAAGPTHANKLYIWLQIGSSILGYDDIIVDAITPSETVQTWFRLWVPQQQLYLPDHTYAVWISSDGSDVINAFPSTWNPGQLSSGSNTIIGSGGSGSGSSGSGGFPVIPPIGG